MILSLLSIAFGTTQVFVIVDHSPRSYGQDCGKPKLSEMVRVYNSPGQYLVSKYIHKLFSTICGKKLAMDEE